MSSVVSVFTVLMRGGGETLQQIVFPKYDTIMHEKVNNIEKYHL